MQATHTGENLAAQEGRRPGGSNNEGAARGFDVERLSDIDRGARRAQVERTPLEIDPAIESPQRLGSKDVQRAVAQDRAAVSIRAGESQARAIHDQLIAGDRTAD